MIEHTVQYLLYQDRNQECLAVSYQDHFIKTLPVFSLLSKLFQCSMMEELEEKDLWIAVWVFSGQAETEGSDGPEPDIKYLNIFPGDKIVSLGEDEVREQLPSPGVHWLTTIMHYIDISSSQLRLVFKTFLLGLDLRTFSEG